jgi:hypothetical protein
MKFINLTTSIFYTVSTQNWNITDIVIKMDAVGLMCER